jgi:hypothetical protein
MSLNPEQPPKSIIGKEVFFATWLNKTISYPALVPSRSIE